MWFWYRCVNTVLPLWSSRNAEWDPPVPYLISGEDHAWSDSKQVMEYTKATGK